MHYEARGWQHHDGEASENSTSSLQKIYSIIREEQSVQILKRITGAAYSMCKGEIMNVTVL